MDALHSIAEAKIREAIANGLFDDLPGKGRPLALPDLSRVPEDLRSSYLLLENAGYLPEEMVPRKEIKSLQDLLRACTERDERAALQRKVSARSLRLQTLMAQRRSPAWHEYGPRVLRRLLGGPRRSQ